ncbi:MAG TPA: Trm112 family protein [Methanothermococcus okinawensis]|uniref:Trm112 family protein n=1 Tax=Methanothermococcus okinawensis TaxID=155863 RepID=A0A832ZY84_9EURY|nr:Trm112 family protein [Methanothermococcus okinawensis]
MTWVREYLEILQCPACGGDLELLEEKMEYKLQCKRCGESYPIVDDIPILLRK